MAACAGTVVAVVPPAPAAAAVPVETVRQWCLARADRASRHTDVVCACGNEHLGKADRTRGLMRKVTVEHAGLVVQNPVDFTPGHRRGEAIRYLRDRLVG